MTGDFRGGESSSSFGGPLLTTTPTWGRREIGIGIVAALIAVAILAFTIVYPVVAAYGENSVGSLAAQAIASMLWEGGLVLIVYRLVKSKAAGWRQLGLRKPSESSFPVPQRKRVFSTTIPWTFWAIAGGLAVSYSLVYSYGIIVSVFDIEVLKPSQQLPDRLFDHDLVVALFAIATVGSAPIAEEIFFRGFIFGGLRRGMGFLPASLISGGLFSVAHTNAGLVIPFTLVGMVMANTYERSGTLYASITVHFFFNLFSFLILVLVPEARNQ